MRTDPPLQNIPPGKIDSSTPMYFDLSYSPLQIATFIFWEWRAPSTFTTAPSAVSPDPKQIA